MYMVTVSCSLIGYISFLYFLKAINPYTVNLKSSLLLLQYIYIYIYYVEVGRGLRTRVIIWSENVKKFFSLDSLGDGSHLTLVKFNIFQIVA